MVSGSAGIEESTVINKRPEPPQWSFYFNGTDDAGQLGMEIKRDEGESRSMEVDFYGKYFLRASTQELSSEGVQRGQGCRGSWSQAWSYVTCFGIMKAACFDWVMEMENFWGLVLWEAGKAFGAGVASVAGENLGLEELCIKVES